MQSSTTSQRPHTDLLQDTRAKLDPLFHDAFKRLGFLPGAKRHDCFFSLMRQYYQKEGQETLEQSQKENLNLTHDDILDYIAVKFIQDHGDTLWPKDPRKRGHLDDHWVQTNRGQKRVMTFVASRDQNCRKVKANERTMWENKLRSPLGKAVRHYLGLMKQVPDEFLNGSDRDEEFLMRHILALGNDGADFDGPRL